jgi:hypothetical protein
MCWSCVSQVDFVAATAVAGAATGTKGVQELRDALGVSTLTSEQRTWRAHTELVAFCESLELDPELVLGPAPPPAPVPESKPRPVRDLRWYRSLPLAIYVAFTLPVDPSHRARRGFRLLPTTDR